MSTLARSTFCEHLLIGQESRRIIPLQLSKKKKKWALKLYATGRFPDRRLWDGCMSQNKHEPTCYANNHYSGCPPSKQKYSRKKSKSRPKNSSFSRKNGITEKKKKPCFLGTFALSLCSVRFKRATTLLMALD